MEHLEADNSESIREIEAYLYDQKVIHLAIDLLKRVKVEGFEQAQLLGELGKLLCSPVKTDTLQIEACDLQELS